jgi:tetratricopeptide (TPR) repeat protein
MGFPIGPSQTWPMKYSMQVARIMVMAGSAVGVRYAAAQDVTRQTALSAACIEFNQTAMNHVAVGRLKDAESALSAALADRANDSEQSCAWLTLHNLADVMALSGRLAEAEVLEKRSLKILEKGYPPDDPVLLRPLESLSQIQFEQWEIAKARETFQRLQSIPTERPADRAIIDSLAAALLYAEGRHHEAEAAYLKALVAWEEAGRGETPDVAAVLDGLATLYIVNGRYREAGRTLDRVLAILDTAKDAVPMDRIKLFRARAELHARQGEWREAEADLGSAISTADRDTRMDPAVLKSLLANYALVLRKNHRGREARTIEARAAALKTHELTNGVVDISELLAKPKTAKK